MLTGSFCHAQICTGSLGAPVINETFGSDSTNTGIGPPLSSSITNLNYVYGSCAGDDNTYAITTRIAPSCHAGTWQSAANHTPGDPNGYFMVINASVDPKIFFTEKADGSKLCPGAPYFFSVWIMNILRPLPQTQGFVEPNITLTITTVNGTVLKTINTGNIPATDEVIWRQYGTMINAPTDGSDLVVKITSNAPGGNGNDLAIDDITFSPCGPLIQTGFGTIGNVSPQNHCANDSFNYTLVSSQTGYDSPNYQWQQRNLNDNKGWVNIAGAITTSLPVSMTNAKAGTYQYRIGILNGVGGLESCRIFSDPLTINVYPAPSITLAAATAACAGGELQLSVTGATDYQWAGPNNFTATGASPVVSYNADASINGTYTVIATKDGCPYFGSTMVTVYDRPEIQPLNNVSICQGGAVQLNTVTQNATHYKWTPSAGLDHDDIANPIASPADTTMYTVEVSNDGCDAKPISRVTVNVLKKPVANAGYPFKMFEGDTKKLQGKAIGDSISYYWSPPDYLDNPLSLTPTTSATGDITYTLHVVSEANCGESTSSVSVRVYKKLTIPNTFTPNGDGINDYWDIKNMTSYPQAVISVYSRSGALVYQSKGYAKPWDGKFAGKTLPAGSYYYLIDLHEDDLQPVSGWILLVN